VNILDGSLVFRVVRRAVPWITRAARFSLTGRLVLASAAAVGRSFADSRVFGRIPAPRPIARGDQTVCVSALARPYLGLKKSAGGVCAHAARAGRPAASSSAFAAGAWLWIVGAGIFAMGAGLLASGPAASGGRRIASVCLMAVGALVVGVGPRLGSAVRQSVLLRGVSRAFVAVVEGPRDSVIASREHFTGAAIISWRRLAGPLGVGMALALAAGLVAGLGGPSAAMTVVFLVLALCLLALVLWRPEVMLLAAAAFPWMDWIARRTLGGLGAAWDEAFLLLFLLLLLGCVIARRRMVLWTVPIALPAILALAAGIGSVVLRHVPGNVGLYALRLVFQPMLFYFLGFLFPKNKRWVQWTVAVFLLASLALALHGIYQYISHAPMPRQWVDVREVGIGTRAYSIIENPNGLGAFLLIGVLVSMGLALAPGQGRLRRGTMGLVCVILLCGEAVTFSRGSWLGLVAGVLSLLILAHRRYLAPLFTALLVGWFAMPRVIISRLTFAFSGTYIAQSLMFGRLYIWMYSLRQIAAHPWFGLGLGTFGGTSAVRFAYSGLWVDNFYIQLAAEGGLILLGLFLWILLSAARGLVRGHQTCTDPYLRGLAAGTFGAFVAVAVANMSASVWETLVAGLGFWFLAGLATAASLQMGQEATSSAAALRAESPVGPGTPQEEAR
jgi:putative inorganic carbon (HCO3(-)) transporter